MRVTRRQMIDQTRRARYIKLATPGKVYLASPRFLQWFVPSRRYTRNILDLSKDWAMDVQILVPIPVTPVIKSYEINRHQTRRNATLKR